MLLERSLPSVVAQTLCPDVLVVVDDSEPLARQANAELVGTLTLPGCEIIYLENARTAGASGAWNTAIDHLAGAVDEPDRVFIAVLDDDDAWPPEYLERCALAARRRSLDMVAAGLRRFESGAGHAVLNEAPMRLCAEEFLTGNPGIQGSNLFARLSVLLAAGGFDEGLRSSTDRDLCIRIAELGTVRYGRLSGVWVDHYADSDRPRLSASGSAAKFEGLTAFWQKYAGRMTADQRHAFAERAAALFDWSAPDKTASPSSVSARRAGDFGQPPPHAPIRLHVGVITSEPSVLWPLLDGLATLALSNTLERLSVLILDNGSPADELKKMTQEAQAAGLRVAVVDEPRQRRDAASGGFGAAVRARPQGQVGIAMARTMLQRYLGAVLAADAGSFGWLLDDDMRVDARARAYLPWLPAFRARGTDALIGAYEGASPNPPLNGLRVQLVDLLHNLRWLQALPDQMPLPDRTMENAGLCARFPDYYYDLSRKHTAHLEMPHWLEPAFFGETVKEAYARLLAGAVGLLNGDPLTRPIISTPPSDPLAAAKASVNRGGCTFILNHRVLTDTPNSITKIQGREARRSDMVWAIVNRYYRRSTIQAVAFPIHHIGRVNVAPGLNLEKVQGEIIGSTLYAGLTGFLRSRPNHALAFSPEESDAICDLADQQLTRRWRMLKQSVYRIMGLREAIRRVVRPGELRALLGYLDAWFTPAQFEQIRAGLGAHDRVEVRRFLSALRTVADDYARAAVEIDFIQEQLKVASC